MLIQRIRYLSVKRCKRLPSAVWMLHLVRKDSGFAKNDLNTHKQAKMSSSSSSSLSKKNSSYLFPPRRENDIPNLHIIISAQSGTGKAQHYFDNFLKKELDLVKIEASSYQLHVTESESSIEEFTESIVLPRANKGIDQTIILLSGDGGVSDVVNVLLMSMQSEAYVKPVIGLIPLGTGNALAHSLGISLGTTKDRRTLLEGVPRNLPTLRAAFSPGSMLITNLGKTKEPLLTSDRGFSSLYGAVVCSWALHASLAADSDTAEYRKYGSERFQMVAKELLAPSDGSSSHVYRAKITLFTNNPQGESSEIIEGHDHMYLLVTLVSNLEEKLVISPLSRPLDGQLRLLHFGPLSSGEVMEIFELAYQGGQHVKNQAVLYHDIEKIRIDFEESEGRWRRVCLDGKIVEVNEGGWVEISRERRDLVDIIAPF